ncbi:MAG: transposase [Amphritea sp.]
MNNCGIDLASRSSAVCIMGDGLNILWERECLTDAAGFGQALQGKGKLRCIVEASLLCEWVADMLEDLGHEVIVIDPRKAKAIITSKKKTDKLDARNLARMGQTGWYTEFHRKSTKVRLLRSHLKARKGMVDAQQQQNNRIRDFLRAHGLKVGQVSNGQFAARVVDLVEHSCPGLMTAIRPLLDIWGMIWQKLVEMTKQVKQLAIKKKTCPVTDVDPRYWAADFLRIYRHDRRSGAFIERGTKCRPILV